MSKPRYQYNLYGLLGEFMGLTTKRATALAHKAKSDAYYFRRYEFDADDPDWQRAAERELTCEDTAQELVPAD